MLFAAFAQAFRFMVQKRLWIGLLSTGGTTFSRFLYSAPLISAVAIGHYLVRGYGLPRVDGHSGHLPPLEAFAKSSPLCVWLLYFSNVISPLESRLKKLRCG